MGRPLPITPFGSPASLDPTGRRPPPAPPLRPAPAEKAAAAPSPPIFKKGGALSNPRPAPPRLPPKKPPLCRTNTFHPPADQVTPGFSARPVSADSRRHRNLRLSLG